MDYPAPPRGSAAAAGVIYDFVCDSLTTLQTAEVKLVYVGRGQQPGEAKRKRVEKGDLFGGVLFQRIFDFSLSLAPIGSGGGGSK